MSGTGKTLLLFEFLYRGAKKHGEKGIFFSFEETVDRIIIANAKGMGRDIGEQINNANIEIVHIPFGIDKMGRFSVKETVVDGIIVLTAVNDEKTLRRNRFIEIYKLRNSETQKYCKCKRKI